MNDVFPTEYLGHPPCSICQFPAASTLKVGASHICLCRRCSIQTAAQLVISAHLGASGRPAAGMIHRVADDVAEQIFREGDRLLRERGSVWDLTDDAREACRKSINRHYTRQAPRLRPAREVFPARKRSEAVIPVPAEDPEEEPHRRRGRPGVSCFEDDA